MSNIGLSGQLISTLRQKGIGEWVVCAGSRNAPLVKILSQSHQIKTHWFFEERSAAYFALGRSQALNAPVAVITTSGTAVANLLPAVIEAHYKKIPLVIVTADRPPHYRGTGAPQSIEQLNIFSTYAHETIQWNESKESQISDWVGEKPLHINFCIDEPLIDQSIKSVTSNLGQWRPLKGSSHSEAQVISSLKSIGARPLMILSGLTSDQAQLLEPLLKKLDWPVYVESGSQVKNLELKIPLGITAGEFALQHFLKTDCFSGVVAVGGTPTVRLWRDLEESDLPVVRFSSTGFSGIARQLELFPFDALLDEKVSSQLLSMDYEGFGHLKANNKQLTQLKEKALGTFRNSEVSLMQDFVNHIGEEDQVFIGNSLPIRELDLVNWSHLKKNKVYTQRGVNGIDGLISTGLGVASEIKNTWIVIGDLTFMYDLAGIWSLKQNPELKVHFVVVNNGGGKIFSRIYDDPAFENRHGLNFKSIADFWGLNYHPIHSAIDFIDFNKNTLIEIFPDAKESKDLWELLKTICQ